ncbi:MAG: serine/threonine protein kinase [Polyangiaceae bacterium]|nr:serine/threonine protein kinase [Polyangiaceae bacterium]
MAEDAFGIVGSVIAGAYHVESVVAEGGFGTVYRAHHGGFRAPVALKCLRLPFGLSPEARQHFLDSFRAEAELLFLLSSSIPTVVRPLHVDAFTLPEPDSRFVPYMVLEWLEGHTLDATIRRRRSEGQAPFALKKMVRLLTPVARALERAHNFRGPNGPVSVVHRDIKPENIFVANVAGEEVVKILDFGIGKAKSMVSQVAGRASQEASSGIATFTPAYGSPEQWAPKRYGQTGPWTDVWGLALTLTEALVGHPVIDGDSAAIMGTVLDEQRRPTPGSEGVIISDEVERVFEKALALDPRRRYADAGVFWNELLAAARITSGEVQEVRLPRDARAEGGGGPLMERVEVSRRPTRSPAPVLKPLAFELEPVISSAAPDLRVAAPAPLPHAVSESFEVPDLDLSPVSRPAPPRTSSGLRPALAAPLDLDDASDELGGGASLDLDLPSHDPLARRVSSAGMQAVRSPSNPPPASVRGQPASAPPAHVSYPPAHVSYPPAHVSHPPPSPRASSPPPAAAARVLPAAVTPKFRLKLGAEPDATLVERLLPGGVVVAAAIGVTILDQLYSIVSGEVFTLLGMRASVPAGLFMLLGIAWCVYRLKRD